MSDVPRTPSALPQEDLFGPQRPGEAAAKMRLECPDCGWLVCFDGFAGPRTDGSGDIYVRSVEPFPDHPKGRGCVSDANLSVEFFGELRTEAPGLHVRTQR